MKNLKIYVFVLLVMSIFFSSCESDEDGSEAQDKNQAQEMEKVMSGFKEKVGSMKLPKAMVSSSNEGAQAMKQMFDANKKLVTDITTQMYSVPENAEQLTVNNTQEFSARGGDLEEQVGNWKWSVEGDEVIYNIQELADRYNVSYIIKGNGIDYLIKGFISKSGDLAEYDYFLNDSLISSLEWRVDGDNGYVKMTKSALKYVLEYDFSDFSGKMERYTDGKLDSKGDWSANGKGTYDNEVSGKFIEW